MKKFLTDARGQHKVELGRANFERVKKWVKENPDASKGEACKALGITYKTLSAHLKKMN